MEDPTLSHGEMMAKTDTERTKERLRPKAEKVKKTVGLSTGSTLVNLAMSGHASWGIAAGTYTLLVGDSASGKTFLALTTLAEASINPAFKDHRLVCFAPERGARMNVARYFGKRLAERIEWRYPETVERFYFDVDTILKEGPAVVVLDSMDALTSEDELDKFAERKKAADKGKDVNGSYGTSKAKQNSADLRVTVNRLEESGSILVIISQTRDNIGFGAQFNPKTRSGGKALSFYATSEAWFSVGGQLKRTVKGKPRNIGSELIVKIRKNRETGAKRDVTLHHYPSYGFDDVGSMVAYLIDEGHWTETKGRVSAPEFKAEGFREAVIAAIEKQNGERTLRTLVAECWRDIENACAVQRKPRYV